MMFAMVVIIKRAQSGSLSPRVGPPGYYERRYVTTAQHDSQLNLFMTLSFFNEPSGPLYAEGVEAAPA